MDEYENRCLHDWWVSPKTGDQRCRKCEVVKGDLPVHCRGCEKANEPSSGSVLAALNSWFHGDDHEQWSDVSSPALADYDQTDIDRMRSALRAASVTDQEEKGN